MYIYIYYAGIILFVQIIFRCLSKQSFACSDPLKLAGPSPARFTCLLLDSSLA